MKQLLQALRAHENRPLWPTFLGPRQIVAMTDDVLKYACTAPNFPSLLWLGGHSGCARRWHQSLSQSRGGCGLMAAMPINLVTLARSMKTLPRA